MRTRQILSALFTLFVGSSLMFAGTVSGKVTYTNNPVPSKKKKKEED